MTIIPINVDRNASTRDYDSVPKRHLLVTSLFHTFQGEGPYAGWPALFIRLAGCNIGAKEDCPWCDTSFQLYRGFAMPFEHLHDTVSALRREDKISLVVITGGEPMLQYPTIEQFLNERLDRDCDLIFQFETNGQLMRRWDLDAANAEFVVSPKIPHNRAAYRPMDSVWLNDPGRVCLKYVVSANPESPYHRLPDDLLLAQTAGVQVYVWGVTVYRRQPAHDEVANIWDTTMIDHDATARNYRHAATLAVERNLRVSFQTHLFGGFQ
jgi:organic radical activating enzyme